jgi:dephospho-CoA kinase
VATIGIAGYMGSGKSTISEILARLGAVVIDADSAAKELMNADAGIRGQLAAEFGSSIVDGEKLLFHALGNMAFHSLENMTKLNRIVHPALLRELDRRIRQIRNTMLVLDAALISLWKIEGWFDVVCWVDADFDVRFERLALKQNIPAEEIRRRMRLQEQIVKRPCGGRWREVKNNDSKKLLEPLCRDIIEGCGL